MSPEDFYNLFERCPTWRLAWTRALSSLFGSGTSQYRTFVLSQTDDRVIGTQNGARMFVVNRNDHHTLFEHCHHDLLSLLRVFSNMPAKSSQIEQALVWHWPVDQAWKDAIASIAPSVSSSSFVSARYLPRLLSERKHATIVEQTNNTWKTKKGVALEKMLRRSSENKRNTLEMLMDLPKIASIEFSSSLDFDCLMPIANTLTKGLATQRAKKLWKHNTSWSLAFRRIQGMGLKGCFDAASQTIIVDPRHVDTLIHEVCHWLLGHEVNTRQGQRVEEQQVDKLIHQVFKQ